MKASPRDRYQYSTRKINEANREEGDTPEVTFLPVCFIVSLLSHAVSLCPRIFFGDKVDKLQTVIERYLDRIVAFCTHNTDKSWLGRDLNITCIDVYGLYSCYDGSFIVQVDNFACGLSLLTLLLPTAIL